MNYDPQHVPIVATRLVDVGASPHIHLIQPLGDPEDTPLLVNLHTEAKFPPGRVWEDIFHADFPDTHMEPKVGDRAVVYAIPGPTAHPTPREDTTPTHKLPHLEAFAQEVVNLLTPQLKVQMHLIHAGYVRVQVKERQFWHRDIALALGTAGVHALTVFSAVNKDIPMDDNVGNVVLGSHEGVPNPWVTAPLALGTGDLWVLDSRCIHQGGGPCQHCPW